MLSASAELRRRRSAATMTTGGADCQAIRPARRSWWPTPATSWPGLIVVSPKERSTATRSPRTKTPPVCPPTAISSARFPAVQGRLPIWIGATRFSGSARAREMLVGVQARS